MTVRLSRAQCGPIIIAALVAAAFVLPVVASTVSASPATGAPNGLVLAHLDSGAPLASADSGRKANLPPDPSNCTQGSQTITVVPQSGNVEPALLSAYDTLGAEGGGTLLLEAGTYQLNETLFLRTYGNVSIQGAGEGLTVLSAPPDPIGNFTADNGSLVGLFNQTTGGPMDGVPGALIETGGPLDNLELCDLTVDAQATSEGEDWSGSLIMDSGGGQHHVYSNIDLDGFYGPSGTPNGLHIDGYTHPAQDYVIDDLVSGNYSWPSSNHTFIAGGPNFLNTGDVTNCTEENITGSGDFEYEVAPSVGCTVQNVAISGTILIDPSIESTNTGGSGVPAGSWGGTLFQNVTVDVDGTGGPAALGISVNNGSSNGGSDFSDLRWNDDHFVGSVLNGRNMVDVENSTFVGGINSLPAVFRNNSVEWSPTQDGRDTINPPVVAYGTPLGGLSSVVAGDSFTFPQGTGKTDPFELTVGSNLWVSDSVAIANETRGYLLSAPNVAISPSSSFSNLSYDSLGNDSPPDLVLFDIVGSPGFQDLGATVTGLSGIFNDLPDFVPTTPAGLAGSAPSPTELQASWYPSSGPVTNYTVLVQPSSNAQSENYSAGLETEISIENLTPGTAYTLGVEAWNGSFHSSVSSSIVVITPDYAPGTPSGLVTSAIDTTHIQLSWNAPTGIVTNYTLLTGTTAFDLSDRLSVGEQTFYDVSGLDPNTTYYFEVEAWNSTWSSAPSASVNATTLPNLPTTPAPSFSFDDGLIVLANLGAVVLAIVAILVILSRRRPPTQRKSRLRAEKN